jgi:hypothetical protein
MSNSGLSLKFSQTEARAPLQGKEKTKTENEYDCGRNLPPAESQKLLLL